MNLKTLMLAATLSLFALGAAAQNPPAPPADAPKAAVKGEKRKVEDKDHDGKDEDKDKDSKDSKDRKDGKRDHRKHDHKPKKA